MHLTRACVVLALLLPLGACADDGPEPTGRAAPTTTSAAPAPSTSSPAAGVRTTSPEVVATGLEAPWGIAFLPDGDALVSERDTTRIVRVPAGGGPPVEVRRMSEARPAGEGGLLGLAVSPEFATDGMVYAYLTAEDDNRVVRFPLEGGSAVPVVTGIPKGTVHNGGRIAFGPDGNLYVGTGDVGDRSLAQDRDSLGGKVLRVTPDGEPVDGTKVFTLGHRNVQGLAFDSSGRLWATEFGQNRLDEVNVLKVGGNYGWPLIEGVGDDARFVDPVTTWSTDQASPSGGAVVGDSFWVAALRGQRLWRVPLASPGSRTALFEGDFGRLRAAATAPDGSLWVLTSNRDGRGSPVAEDDRVLRLAPA
ncbi:MAG: PQQ-dependent sugar dehydrogenase [Mycobacteriales bacterium]|nr:PQQ-dependent sugar dehydrogenase [Mycobacteriales bacterium]